MKLNFLKELFCKHAYKRHWSTHTVLNNGHLATLKIHECIKCGRVKTVVVAKADELR